MRIRPHKIGVSLAKTAIQLYQWLLSPWLGKNCCFEPTCSCYAHQALEEHGLVRGIWLTAKRLAKCHPGQTWTYDPVPKRTKPL